MQPQYCLLALIQINHLQSLLHFLIRKQRLKHPHQQVIKIWAVIEDDVPSNEITLGKALQISGKSTRANSKALADNEIQVADQSEQLYPLVYGNNTILFEEMVYDANGSSFTLYKYNVNEGALSQIGNYAYDYRYENGTILDDRYYFRAPCVVDDGGNLIVQWQKIDCNTGEMEIVYSETVQSLYYISKKL